MAEVFDRDLSIETRGAPLAEARGAVVLVHGRGATAESMLSLAPELGSPGLTFVAPSAAGNSWYPASFLAPLEVNGPRLEVALARLERCLEALETAGIPAARSALVGFSQGACLTLEFVARHARRYGLVVGWTGGLIGPPGALRSYEGSLAGTPVLLSTGDPDPHVPRWRVEETAAVLRELGGEVDLQVFPGRPHTVSAEEVTRAKEALARLSAAS